ncbi:MAG: polysaccharide deacetylase family protein [Blautia sp.]|nr:polysaccharide deacetylase family protein [Blautia sp.]MCM1202167.1 polysaccharide deacetylase family protein [Bacteroides fragilis]
MKIIFSWDDGALEDQRLFEIHEKYEIPGMFFVPTGNAEGRKVLTPEMIRNAESEYVAFGGHTENHKYLTDIPPAAVEGEIRNNKEYLEEILSHEVNSFCFPGGRYDPAILKTAKKYYRRLRTADTMCFRDPADGLLKPAIHFYPRGIRSLMGNAVKNGSYRELFYVAAHRTLPYFELIQRLIEFERDRDGVVAVWGHSWEIEKYGLWETLEELIKSIKSFGICRFSAVYEGCERG